MATTTVSDAVVVPQAKGTGLGSEDDNVDAASAALLAAHSGGEYVRLGMGFTRDDTNNEIDVGAGFCYIIDDSTSTGGSRGSGGNAQIQSTSSSGYDTEIPDDQVYLVIFPTTASVSVSDATASDIWVNITDVTSNNAVELRSSSGGGTTSAPSDTFIKLGNISDSGSGQATRSNDRKGDPAKIRLETQTASSASSVDFTTGINASFDRYVIEVTDVVPANDIVELWLRVSTDGGSSWKSGASDYAYHNNIFDSGGTNNKDSSSGDSKIILSGNISHGSAAGEGGTNTVKFSNPANGSLQQLFQWDSSFVVNDGDIASVRGAGAYSTAEAINGIRFLFGSGNIESGTFSLYGVVK